MLATLFFSRPNLPEASTMASSVDSLYSFIFWVSTVSFLVIVFGMVYFCIRYRRKSEDDVTPYIEGHPPTEIGVSIGLLVIVMIMFAWGYKDFTKERTPPANAYEINVIAQQWSWTFQYADGRTIMNDLYVPVNTPVKLILASKDVLHSFYIPAFRMKRDVVPGSYNFLLFTADKVGTYDIFCAEFCGTGHSAMLGKVHVLSEEDFANWEDKTGKYNKALAKAADSKGGKSLVDMGKEVYTAKGCNACHSLDGSKGVGPSYKGLYDSKVELADGSTVTADENYIRESIMDPSKQVVKGFAPIMPTFKGMLSDEEINALVAFIKSLK